MRRDRRPLLGEIESIINTMPERATIRHTDKPENIAWFGRAAAAIEKWSPLKSRFAKDHIDLFFSTGHARETAHGLTKLLALLHQAKTELEWEVNGPQSMGGVEMGKKIFIGHGRSNVWYQLKAFLNDRLNLECDEFNAEAVAGMSTTARLGELLNNACFAFLVMTGEDLHVDEQAHARENVIHEAGLFQGRLGFERAIILLEEGCAQFSNIHGLNHISFPKGQLSPAFEQIRHVLERESVHSSSVSMQRSTTVGNTTTHPTSVSTGSQCPRCSQDGWDIESSAPDPVFGVLGVTKRVYKCRVCGFSESKQIK